MSTGMLTAAEVHLRGDITATISSSAKREQQIDRGTADAPVAAFDALPDNVLHSESVRGNWQL